MKAANFLLNTNNCYANSCIPDENHKMIFDLVSKIIGKKKNAFFMRCAAGPHLNKYFKLLQILSWHHSKNRSHLEYDLHVHK